MEKAASLKKRYFFQLECPIYQINSAIKILNKNGCKKDITVLHCTTNYPAKPDELNLAALKLLKKFKINVGYSDHSLGILAPIIALSYGASVIEKHFTLNKTLKDLIIKQAWSLKN